MYGDAGILEHWARLSAGVSGNVNPRRESVCLRVEAANKRQFYAAVMIMHVVRPEQITL